MTIKYIETSPEFGFIEIFAGKRPSKIARTVPDSDLLCTVKLNTPESGVGKILRSGTAIWFRATYHAGMVIEGTIGHTKRYDLKFASTRLFAGAQLNLVGVQFVGLVTSAK